MTRAASRTPRRFQPDTPVGLEGRSVPAVFSTLANPFAVSVVNAPAVVSTLPTYGAFVPFGSASALSSGGFAASPFASNFTAGAASLSNAFIVPNFGTGPLVNAGVALNAGSFTPFAGLSTVGYAAPPVATFSNPAFLNVGTTFYGSQGTNVLPALAYSPFGTSTFLNPAGRLNGLGLSGGYGLNNGLFSGSPFGTQYTAVVSPYGGMVSPYGGTIAPYGSTIAPFGSTLVNSGAPGFVLTNGFDTTGTAAVAPFATLPFVSPSLLATTNAPFTTDPFLTPVGSATSFTTSPYLSPFGLPGAFTTSPFGTFNSFGTVGMFGQGF